MDLGITSPVWMWLCTVAALAMPVALALWWPRQRGRGWSRAARGALLVLVLFLTQALALGAVFLAVNREYEFYTSWGDVVGERGVGRLVSVPIRGQKPAHIVRIPISRSNPNPHGRLVDVTIAGGAGGLAPVQVYLPAAYDEPHQARRTFPVVVMVAGMGMPGPKFARLLDAVNLNSSLIESGKASPFIAVYVAGTIVPGIDSECLDVPGADQESYLTTAVPEAIGRQFRVDADPAHRFIAGWSTGGYCAALMVSKHPEVYGAGAALAGYYHPMFNDPSLVHQVRGDRAANSLVARLRAGSLRQLSLMSIMSTSDAQSWGPADQTTPVNGQAPPDGRTYAALSTRLPGTATLALTHGGHTFGTYVPEFPGALAWLGQRGL